VGYIVELAKGILKMALIYCFVAIGDGMEKQQVIADAEKAGINKNLYIYYRQSRKLKLFELLSAADLFVIFIRFQLRKW